MNIGKSFVEEIQRAKFGAGPTDLNYTKTNVPASADKSNPESVAFFVVTVHRKK